MKTGCPYCDANSFECEALPANSAAADNSPRYGDWFNQCADCKKWSRYDEETGDQLIISSPGKRPNRAKAQ